MVGPYDSATTGNWSIAMVALDCSHLETLVSEERVHRDVYLDADIFELEMERIFGQAWVYVGHESMVPNPGDYICAYIGSQPIVLSRHASGKTHVLLNRCGHRGAKVLSEDSGHSDRFRCCYHGWTYDTDGRLIAVPMNDLYPDDFDLDDPRYSMRNVAAVDSYRGFVFARLSETGQSLTDHLGPARSLIDELVNRAPDGEVELVGGSLKYEIQGNWKLQVENLADQYHVPFGHESTASRDGFQFQRRTGDAGTRAQIFSTEGEPSMQQSGTWGYPNGHNANGAMNFDGEQEGDVWQEYKSRMIASYGEKKAAQNMHVRHHNALFYPNLDLHMLGQMVRVIRPISVNTTEVTIYPARLKGAPDEMFQDVVRLANMTHSATSLIQTDDVESFERCQAGLHAEGEDWISFVRGLGMDNIEEDGLLYGPMTSEIGMRNQHRAWLGYMTTA